MPAYNSERPFHKKHTRYVGYLIYVSETWIYHAGDTEPVPEMTDISADILMAPVSGKWVATPAEAAEIVRMVQPHIAIPMHFGAPGGTRADAEQFKALSECQVVILEKDE